MPFFSIIIPDHNSEKYILRGLESIKNQSFTNYELIIVCDKCTDNTKEIALKYTDKVYESDFGSAGGARNIGLNNATGTWVLFMDDDDWFLHEYVFEQLHEHLKDDRINEVCAFSFIFKTYGYAKCNRWDAVWNKAWRLDYLNKHNYRFPSTLLWDDTKFTHDALPNAKVDFWDMPLYYYNYMREGSVTWQKDQGLIEDIPQNPFV